MCDSHSSHLSSPSIAGFSSVSYNRLNNYTQRDAVLSPLCCRGFAPICRWSLWYFSRLKCLLLCVYLLHFHRMTDIFIALQSETYKMCSRLYTSICILHCSTLQCRTNVLWCTNLNMASVVTNLALPRFCTCQKFFFKRLLLLLFNGEMQSYVKDSKDEYF